MNTNYQVVLKGVGAGHLREDVAKKLAPLFKISVDQADQMLDQHDLVVKKGIDFQAAVRYVEALENCGCFCEVQPEATPSTEPTAAAQPSPSPLSESAERLEPVRETSTPIQEVSSESTHEQRADPMDEQEAWTPIHEATSESSHEQRDVPLAEKVSRPKLIVVGAAVMVAAVVAIAGYKIFGNEDNRPPSIVEKSPNTVEQQSQNIFVEGDYLKESQTVAGAVTINDGELLLNGKLVYSDEGYTVGIWKAFNFPDKTVLLLYKGGMGSSCPTLFMFLTVKRDGQVAYTEEFGSCSDLVTATVDSKSIVVSIPDISGGGDESWRYADEALSQIKYVDPNIKKNADQIEGADGSSVRVRGTLVRTADNQGWELKLTRTTIFPGCSIHNRLIDSLPIDPGATIPDVQGESEFEVSLSCPNSGASISFIDIPGRARDTSAEVEPSASLVGTWNCQEEDYQDTFTFGEDGSYSMGPLDGSGIRVSGIYENSGNKITMTAQRIAKGSTTQSINPILTVGSITKLNGSELRLETISSGTKNNRICIKK